jgi:hypothetical protein
MIGGLQSDVKHLEKRLETGLSGVDAKLERMDVKMDRLVRKKRAPRGWIQFSGLTLKELVGLALLAGAGLAGTLTPEQITAWLH